MKLNLGSGGKYMEGWTNVDSQPMENPDVVLDLSRDPWPWEDNSCEKAVCSHMLEHIGGIEPYFHFWKELYRVMKDSAELFVTVPHPRHDVFLNDPTHQRAVTPDGLCMFSRGHLQDLLKQGIQLTPFWKYLGIDFDIEGPIQFVLDPEVAAQVQDDPDHDWKTRERHEANIVVEYRLTMKAIKERDYECN